MQNLKELEKNVLDKCRNSVVPCVKAA